MRMMPPNLSNHKLLFIGFLYLFIFGINADGCKKGCPRSDSGKLKYLPGIAYNYKFDSVSSIGVQNSQNEETGIKLKGNAILYYEGDCTYTLKLNNIEVQTTLDKIHKDMNNDFNKPIQFTMVNGEIESQICTEENDNEFSLNIKRGIISMFQTSDNKYETDIFGICPTETSTSNLNDGTQIITKIRNLNSCNYRENFVAFYVSGVVNEKSGIKSRPILNGEYIIEQKLINDIYHDIELTETYNSPQQVKSKSILSVKVKTILKLEQQNSDALPQISSKKSKSIIFHHPKNNGVQNIDVLRKVFDETVNLVSGYVKADSAQHFSELIRLMRNADLNTLIELSSVRSELAKKVYFDALIRTGTPESVQAIVKQIGKWNDKERKVALMSLVLVHSIDLNSLNSVANLLTENAEREGYLAIGTLVNKYCKDYSCNNGEVDSITSKFSNALRNCNANTKKDENHIVSVLKGIRNAQHIADSITSQLLQCSTSQHSSRIRVAALQAYSASSCNKQLQENAMHILRDRNEDSEIRIEAYLAAVQCPNGQIANELAELINSETINQVGGFITSHLRAIRDSTDFTKESLKHHLGNIRITKKFPIDPRRFSFNSETSYSIESLGLGAGLDYSVIYSQKGFLPRSLRLNVTNEAFGTSFNMLDISMRQENLEHVLEHFFGPKGFFSQEPQIIFDTVKNYLPNEHGRSKRNVQADANNMALQYKTYGNNDNKFVNDINLDLSMKMFGSELAFLSVGDHIPSNVDELSNILKNIISDFKNNIKKYEKTFEYHSLLQDVEIVYPTGVGLPLEFAVKSSTTGKLDFGIEFDIDNINEESKSRLKFIPSQDLNLETFLRIDSGVLSTGLRTSTNLHSADGADIKVELINDKKGFNIDLQLPRENVELIEFKHNIDFFISEQDKEIKVLPFKQNKKRKTYQPVCFDQLQMFGLTVCYTANLPSDNDLINDNGSKLPFLYNGPMQMSLSLHTEKHIQIKGLYKDNNEFQSWQLMYDTPGSSDSHKTELELKLGVKPKLFARIDFINAQKHLAGEGGVINNDKEFVIYGQFEVDNDKNLQKIGFSKNGKEYRPLIQMIHGNQISNDIAGYKADGRVIEEQPGKYKFDNFRIITPENKETVINGWVEYYGHLEGFDSDLNIKKHEQDYNVNAHFKYQTNSIDVGGFITDNNNPDSKTGGSFAIEYTKEKLKQQMKLQTGIYYLELFNNFENTGEISNDGVITFSNGLEVKNIKERSPLLAGKLNGQVTKKLIEFDFEATRLDKTASLDLKIGRNQRAEGDFELNVKGKLNRHFADLKTKIDVQQGKYIIDSILITSAGTQFNVKGDVNQHITSQNALINMDGTFKLHNNDKENIFKLKFNDIQEKMNGEFKLKRDNVELISFNGDLQRNPDKQNSNIKLVIKDNLTLNSKFNLNKNGRGDYSGQIHIKKIGKPIKINGKFLYALPKFNFDTTITMDDKKIIYKTENEFLKTKFNTKNYIEIGTEKLQFDASSKTTNDGETNTEFLLSLPTERKLNGKFVRHFNSKNKNNDMKLELFDTQPDGKQRSINSEISIKDLERSKRYYNFESKFEYKNFDEKNIFIILNTKHLPKGEHQTADFNVELGGTTFNNHKLNIDFIEFSKEHSIYRISSDYHGKFNLEINGKNYLKNIENDKLIGNYEVQMNLNAPDTNFKTLSLTSNGKILNNHNIDNENVDDNKLLHNLELNLNYKISDTAGGSADIQLKNYNYKYGSYELKHDCHKYGKHKLFGSWKRDIKKDTNGKINSGKIEHTISYETDQNFNGNIKMNTDFNENEYINMHYTIKTTYEKLQDLDILLKLHRSDDHTYTNLLKIKNQDKEYSMTTNLYTGLLKTGIDFNLQTPTDQSKLLAIFEKLQEHHIKGEIIINNIFNIDFNENLELQFKSPEDFYLIGNVNSNKLKLDNIKIDIRGQNKLIKFNIESGNKQIINGNAQYNIKNEKNKIIIEGRGDLLTQNERNSASFTFIRQLFDLNNNDEFGFEYTFNGELGRKNYVSSLKMTNKNFIIKLTGCEESKQCTNFEIQSVLTIKPNDLTNIEHELMILIDLRELGYPYEFELQSKSSKLNLNVKHEIDATITSNNNKKYKLLVNIKPENNLIQIILPKRTIVFESIHVIPQNGLFGKYENSIAFYFDKKNKPNDKAALSLLVDLSGIKNDVLNSNFEIKYENPYLQKPLLIKGEAKADRTTKIASANIIINIFKLDEQKIIGEAKAMAQIDDKQFNYKAESKFYSNGLDFNYKAKALAKFNFDESEIHLESLAEGGGDLKFLSKLYGKKDTFEIQLIGFNQQLFNMKGLIDTNKHLIKTDSTYQIIGSKPIKFITEFSPTKLKAVLKRDGLLTATSELIVGKEGRIQLIKNTDNKPIYNAKLSLDPSTFLKTTYEVNREELNDFMKTAEEELARDTEIAKGKLNEKYEKVSGVIEDRVQKAKDSLPDLSKVIKNYQHNVKSIVNELEEDPALKKLFTEFRHLYEKISALLQDFMQKSTEFYQKIESAFHEFYEKQQQLFYNTIMPALTDLNNKLTEILKEFYSELVKIARQVFDRAHKAWKNFENDFKEFSKPIQELLKPIGDVINEFIKVLTKELTEFSTDIKEYIDKLPGILKELSEKLNEKLIKLRNVDELLIILRDIFQQLETYTISNEGKEFLNKLLNYIEAKLLNKPINDAEELEGLYYSLIQAINSFIIQLTGDHKHDGTPKEWYNSFMQPLSISLDALSKIPVWFSFKLSSLNYLRNERFESLTDLLVFILPSTLDFAPPYQLNGHIADGQHIFTFDGRYITFPGSCRYILAQDSVDNNFTVVANLANGKMQSIILIDKENYVEVNSNALLKLNDKKTEYPVHENGIHVWRRYYTVSLLSTYGVLIKCTTDLRVCHVSVNGFYTAKMRGLFGNGNAEPYDDYMIQNGEIVENSNDFCNSYGLTKCPPVQAQQVDFNQNNPVCNELFDVDSTLLYGYFFIDRKPYREACNTAVQLNSNIDDAACNIALTYASGARLNNLLPVSLPNRCAKCSDSGKKLNIGDEFSTKMPNNKADVIVVVDTELGDELLNEMVQPLFNNLRQQLKARNLNDVHIAVIAFNDKQKYSNILTTNGKLNFNGKLTDMTLTGPKYDDFTEFVGINKLNEFLEKLKEIQTPLSSDYKAVKLALSYPFRSDAAKSILLIREDNKKFGVMDTLASPVFNFLFKNKGLSFNYFGPIEGLTMEGKPAEKVIGFSKRAIAFQKGLINRNEKTKLEYNHSAIIDRLIEDDNVVFSLDNFKQLKSPEQKNGFVTQVSSVLADQLYKTEITSNCLCSLKYGLHGESTCEIQSYEYVKEKKVGGQKQG